MKFGVRYLHKEDLGRQVAKLRFAWLPRRIHDGRWLWLERYIALYEVRLIAADPMLFFLKSLAWVFVGRYSLDDVDAMPSPQAPEPSTWEGA